MKGNKKYLLILHIILAVYSLLGIFSKFASKEPLLSYKFILCYGAVLFGLMIYAFAWQQILKHLPLVTAYANKAVTVIWGIVWGYLFFKEEITLNKVVGAAVIMAGVYIVVQSDYSEGGEEKQL